ncbi:unnamed protein product [Peronospora belbahrii]|uniref:Ankyrin repeat-containing domain n=1 Tax=Peronospora belbahrii TaxID=622444 RepID=A0ABN8D409_9STRA|nr:unnamed protein product [Peronospora belbahrii]
MFTLLEFVLRQYPSVQDFEISSRAISECIELSPILSLAPACTFGSILLLDRIWALSCNSAADRPSHWSLTNFLQSDTFYYRWQFSKSLEVAAARGDLAMVKWLFAHFSGCETTFRVVESAAENGCTPVLEYLMTQNAKFWSEESSSVGNMKLVANQDKVLSQSEKNVVHWHHRAIVVAATRGHFDTVRWLHKNLLCHYGCEEEKMLVIERTHAIALDVEEFELAELLIPQGKKPSDCTTYSRQSVKIEMTPENPCLRWDVNRAVQAVKDLASSDCLDLMQQIAMLHSPLPPIQATWLLDWRGAFINACGRGDFPMMNWLMEYPIGREAFLVNTGLYFRPLCAAAQGNQIEVIHYLYKKGCCDLHGDALRLTMQHVSLSTVKCLVGYMRRMPQLKANDIIHEATKHGRLDVLQYFYNRSTFFHKALTSSLQSPNAMTVAARHGHLELLKWLFRNACGKYSTEVMNVAVRYGHLRIVQWLHVRQSKSCTSDAMEIAAYNGHLEILKWLYANRSESCSSLAIEYAVKQGHLRIAFWLHNNVRQKKSLSLYVKGNARSAFDMVLFLRKYYPTSVQNSCPIAISHQCVVFI